MLNRVDLFRVVLVAIAAVCALLLVDANEELRATNDQLQSLKQDVEGAKSQHEQVLKWAKEMHETSMVVSKKALEQIVAPASK